MTLLQWIGRTSGGKPVVVIRLLVGWVFVCEGIGKFLYPAEQAAGRFASIPAIPWPEFFGPFVGAAEVVFGLLVLLGLFTRVAALVLMIDITVAVLTTKFPILAGQHYGLPALKHYNLWGMLHESRTDFSMWLGCLFLLIVGGGRGSLDARLFRPGPSPRFEAAQKEAEAGRGIASAYSKKEGATVKRERTIWAGCGLLLGVVAAIFGIRGISAPYAAASAETTTTPDDVAALRAEVARLREMATDQSHVMADVAYHYSNLWFAGQAENWPLARFYFDEMRSHLKWAVRVIPVRKDRAGRDVDLGGILTALEQTSLKDLDEAVKATDKARFTAAYQSQLTNCMACHKAASKEFIVLRVPERPDVGMVQFRPERNASH